MKGVGLKDNEEKGMGREKREGSLDENKGDRERGEEGLAKSILVNQGEENNSNDDCGRGHELVSYKLKTRVGGVDNSEVSTGKENWGMVNMRKEGYEKMRVKDSGEKKETRVGKESEVLLVKVFDRLKMKRQGDKEEEGIMFKKRKLEEGSWSVMGSRVLLNGKESVRKGSSSGEVSSRIIIKVKRKKGGKRLSNLVKEENLVEVHIRVNTRNGGGGKKG
ncbi:hypothetical protein DITRI_Ditri18aG0038600 [Diplodiscus trichospermus]